MAVHVKKSSEWRRFDQCRRKKLRSGLFYRETVFGAPTYLLFFVNFLLTRSVGYNIVQKKKNIELFEWIGFIHILDGFIEST